MRTFPVRFWLWLLLLLVVAVPALTTAAFITFGPRPSDEHDVARALDPELRATVVANVARWADPTWQATLAPRLAAAGAEALLVDGAGRVVYRSQGWAASAVPSDPESDRGAHTGLVATTLVVPSDAGTAVAAIALPATAIVSSFPDPPWIDVDFWRIPIAQMAALLAIAGAIALFVHRGFLRPLARVVDGMRQVGAGDLNTRLPRSRVTEVDEVVTAFATMAGALRVSLERQEALEQDRRMTISAVIHDLRTPLFSLRGYLEGLATGLADTPEKRARYVAICRAKADALERLVSDLFAYTRTEYLEEAPRPESLDLGELLRRTVEGLQPQAAAKDVRLTLERRDGPVIVAGDPVLLMRAVENVLDNAVRHTPGGGEVRVDWRRTDDGATFTVTDTGPGIAATDLPHIFTPLYRGEASRNRRTGGAGLGLTIARRLLRAYGGDLTVANALTGGARFSGFLPHRHSLQE